MPAKAGIQTEFLWIPLEFIPVRRFPLEFTPLDTRFRGYDKRGGNDSGDGNDIIFARVIKKLHQKRSETKEWADR